MSDFFKLSENYSFDNKESLTEGVLIDDNALLVYFCISRGFFDPDRGSLVSFMVFHPFEWTSIDYISFLLYVARSYDLKIENISTEMGAVEDEYEVSFEPRLYKGAYKWILELEEESPERDEVLLFSAFLNDTANISDLERALIYADRAAPLYKGETNEVCLSKNLFKTILGYTSFSFVSTPEQSGKLRNDLKAYLELFMQGKLSRNTKPKRIASTYVGQSRNVFTYKKHSDLLRGYLEKMQDDFGNVVTIENTFEDRFPNLEYPDEEYIRRRFSERNFLFIHILLSFKMLGFIKIMSLATNWSFYEDEMLTYQAKIEISPSFRDEDLGKKLDFDLDKSRFYVQGKEIRLSKFKNEYNTLRVIFKDFEEIGKEWFFTEISEEVDVNEVNEKKYYNAIHQLRLKLQAKGINDFFITTKQSVKINSKYLS